MNHLGIRLTTCCTLNCKDCADLMPRSPQIHYDYDLLMQDMNKLLNAIDALQEILLIGGEVFLYPKLKEVIEWALSEPKILNIIIVTNGTIKPNDEILHLLKNPKITFRISGYSDSIVPNRKKLVSLIKNNDIKLQDLEGMIWKDVGDFSCRNRTVKQLNAVWNSCSMNECVGITSKGRIYWCSRSVAADDLSVYPSPLENEYVDVRNTPAELLAQKLEDFYNIEYISTCNYCDGINVCSPAVPTAAQMVHKELVLELLTYYISLRNSDDDILLNEQCIHFFKSNFDSFIYENNLQSIITLLLDEHNILSANGVVTTDLHFSLLKEFNQMLINIFAKYSFNVIDNTGTFSQNTLRKDDCFQKRNSIFIMIQNSTDSIPENIDLALSEDDIKDELLWEKELGKPSALLYACFI